MNLTDFLAMLAVHTALVLFCVGYLVIGANSIRYAKKSSGFAPVVKDEHLPFISVVIPTYNEQEIIADRLDSMLTTSYPKDKMELVIVDSSNDGTPTIIESYARRYPMIRLIRDSERRGLATALNQAYRACVGEIVVKVDSDLVLSSDTLVQIISRFGDAAIGAVTGKVNVANDGASREVSYRGLQEKIQRAETNIDSIFMAHPFAAYRRHLMKDYKPKEYGDETIQTIHIRKQGYRVIYDPGSNFYESFPEDSKERLRQKVRRSEGLIRVLFENADVLFNRRYGKFGSYVFPSNFFMFIISPLLLVITLMAAIVDLALFSFATYLDILILVGFAISYLGRRKRPLSAVWTFIELQYTQLRALLNVTVMQKDDYKWKKIERVASTQS